MNRVSAALILGITALVMASAYIVYDTWLSDEGPAYKAAGGAEYDILIFNDDTSVTSNSDNALWLRARISEQGSGGTGCKDAASEYILNKKSWICGNDGWHYYIDDIEFAQTTEPFVISEACIGKNAGDILSLDVQAVDQSRLEKKPSCGQEAFLLFEQIRKKSESLSL